MSMILTNIILLYHNIMPLKYFRSNIGSPCAHAHITDMVRFVFTANRSVNSICFDSTTVDIITRIWEFNGHNDIYRLLTLNEHKSQVLKILSLILSVWHDNTYGIIWLWFIHDSSIFCVNKIYSRFIKRSKDPLLLFLYLIIMFYSATVDWFMISSVVRRGMSGILVILWCILMHRHLPHFLYHYCSHDAFRNFHSGRGWHIRSDMFQWVVGWKLKTSRFQGSGTTIFII